VTVYEALAGKLPVKAGTNQEWYGALMHWSPTPLSTHCPDMPPAASDAVMKAMSTQASGRFTTCSEFAKAVAASAHAPQVAAVPPPQSAPPPRPQAAPVSPPGTHAPTAPRAPMSGRTKARIAAALFTVLVVSVGWSLGWIGAQAPAGGSVDPSDPTIESRLVLDEVVAFLRRTPEARLLITGHADPTEGSAAYAMGISQRRADGVLEYLVLNGIDGARLRSEARGGSQPLRPGVLADGKTDAAAVAANRRVDLALDAAPAPAADLAAPPATPAPEKEPEPARVAKPSREDMKICPAPFQEKGVEMSITACTNIINLRGVGAADKTFALLHRGRNHVVNEDYVSADRDFSLAIELAPTAALRASALDSRGKARIKAGKTQAGEADLARARASGPVATVKPIPTGDRSFLGTDWKRCLAFGSTADGTELLYALSEVMDVRPTPRFLEQIQSEQPHRPVMLAAGANPETIAFACTSMNTEPQQARDEMDRTLAKFLSDSRGRFPRIRKLDTAWTVRGTGRE
jgi:hypothetical protein